MVEWFSKREVERERNYCDHIIVKVKKISWIPEEGFKKDGKEKGYNFSLVSSTSIYLHHFSVKVLVCVEFSCRLQMLPRF